MEAEQARELALNARLNYWPAHLGLTDDAARIEHLATKLDEAATRIASLETLGEELPAIREERDDFERRWEIAQGRLDRIRDVLGGPTAEDFSNINR